MLLSMHFVTAADSQCGVQAGLQAKYLQPIAKMKVYTKQEEKDHMARVQRLVEGLGAFG